MFSDVAAIIPAAGYGKYHYTEQDSKWFSGAPQDRPKIFEPLTHWTSTMIAGAIRPILMANITTVGIVTNGDEIWGEKAVIQALNHEGMAPDGQRHEFYFAVQKKRDGAADAVRLGLENLPRKFQTILVSMADMPLWQRGIICQLVHLHESKKTRLSMVSVSPKRRSPRTFERYGRIVRDAKGGVSRVVESYEEGFTAYPRVFNPSLYVFSREFLERNITEIDPVEKGDGHPAERHLSKLVEIAYCQEVEIAELPLPPKDRYMALGANTLQEHILTSKILAAIEAREYQKRIRARQR